MAKTATGVNPASPPLIFALNRLHEVHKSWAAVAAALGVSPALISKVMAGTRSPSFKMLRRLGFERRVDYVRVAR